MDIEAHVQLDQVQDVRLDREVRVEVVELEVNRVDAQLRDVE
jgi:hypothetical protein